MARTNIDVVVTVRDGASRPLNEVQKNIKNTGKAAREASVDFNQFNKTLFSTTAFVGTFIKTFSMLRNSLDLGGDLDRLVNQYERVLGPSGKLFASIDGMTTTSIDRMEALRSAITLKGLGITAGTEQIAEVIAKAGTAAKMAGIESSEGIKHFTNFLKDGSVSHLEHLNLIKRTDAGFQLLMETLNKSTKIGGTMLSTQAKLAIGMDLLSKKTAGMLMQAQDLKDITDGLRFAFDWFKRTVGSFIGAAIGPLIAKVIPLIYRFTATLELLKKNSKEMVFLAKTVIVTTGAVLGLVSALGTLRLLVRLLGFAGIGFPGLSLGVLSLGAAFLGLTNNVDGFMNKFKVLGAFFKGIYELVANLDPETGMSKISESTKKLLDDAGIYGFVKMIARVISIVKTALSDLYSGILKVSNTIDGILGGSINKVFTLLGKFTEDWTTWWTSDAISGIEKAGRALVALGGTLAAVFAGKKLFDLAKIGLSKIPILGKLFEGGSSPRGTSSDPIYTRSADGALATGGGFLASALGKAGPLGTLIDLLKQSYKLGGWKQILKDIPSAFSLVFPKLTAVLTRSASIIGGVLTSPLLWQGAALVFAGFVGYKIGSILNGILDKYTQGTTEEGFTGNIVERMMFGAFADQKTKDRFKQSQMFEQSDEHALMRQFQHAQKMGWVKEGESFYDYKARSSTKGDKQTQVSVPSAPSDQEAVIQALGEELKKVNGSEQERMQKAIESGMASGSSGGSSLTYEEIRAIVEGVSDSNELLSRIEANTRSSTTMFPRSDRRSR